MKAGYLNWKHLCKQWKTPPPTTQFFMLTGEPRWPLILKVMSFVPLLCTAAAISPHGILFYCFVRFTESPNWVYLSFSESSHPLLWTCLHPAVANLFPCEVAHLVFLSGGFPRLAFMLPCLVTLHRSAFWAPWWQAAGDRTLEQIFTSNSDASHLRTLLGLADAPSRVGLLLSGAFICGALLHITNPDCEFLPFWESFDSVFSRKLLLSLLLLRVGPTMHNCPTLLGASANADSSSPWAGGACAF